MPPASSPSLRITPFYPSAPIPSPERVTTNEKKSRKLHPLVRQRTHQAEILFPPYQNPIQNKHHCTAIFNNRRDRCNGGRPMGRPLLPRYIHSPRTQRHRGPKLLGQTFLHSRKR